MRISRVVVCALQCVPVTVCCAADTSPDVERSAAPAWIWKAEDRISKERVELQTRFSVKHAVHEVRLKCAADFCSVNLAVDGITRLSIDHYAPLVDRRLDMRLEPGDHTLTLDCRGHAGPSAVALSLAARACVVVMDEHYGIAPHATSADGVAKTGAPVWLCDCHCTLPSAIVPTAALNGGNAAFLRATAAARVPRLQSSWFSPPALTLPQPPPSEPPPWSADLAAEGAVVRL